ncbi:hypothetical protein GGR57DRAFT_516495 [Xylariaceae sp. FL1272]|nr:hypothetical protein GGR57DRAFT_516495 [Xylariaceae sp. FL1272]
MSSTTSNNPPNPIATITNNLGYDVDIYDVTKPNATTSSQGPLTYTLLATVPNGVTAQQVQTIQIASQLQAMRTGTITALNNNYYQQFPVAVLPVLPFGPSADFTLTSDMQQAMEDSFKFIKYSQANPSSQMATNFRTALGDKTSQKNAVNTFFQGTASFQKCTLSTWIAILSWQAQFTNAWQGSYYLSSVPSRSSAGSTTSSSAPALVATLVITASATTSSAVLTMAGTSNENTPVVMTGDGTMQEQNPGTGNLSVSLTPTWLNITQTSQQNGKTVSNYVIGAMFTGTINAVSVAGNLNQVAIPSTLDTSKNATDKNSANGFTFNSFAQLVGMLTSIGMLYYMAKGHKAAETQRENDAQKDATSESDAKAKGDKVETDYQANEVSLVRTESEQLEANTVPEVSGAYKQVNQAADIQNKLSTVQDQEGKLEEILEDGPATQATEDAALNLEKVSTNLEKAMDPATSATERDAAMTDATTTLTDTSNQLDAVLKDQGTQLPQEEEKALSDAKDALNKAQDQADAVEQNEKEQQQQDENDGNEDVDPDQFENPEVEDPAPFIGE